MLVVGDQSMVRWAEERMPDGIISFGNATTIGVIGADNKVMAVAVYMNYRKTDIEMAFAADNPRWATPSNIRGMLFYPFFQLGCRRVTTFTRHDNKRAIRLNEGLGFKLEGRLREAANNGEDMVIYGLTKSDYMQGKYYG